MKKMILALVLIGGVIMSTFAKPEHSEILAVSLIVKYEGFRSYTYTCPGGVKTIGYGFTDKSLVDKRTITKEEANKVLMEKIHSDLLYVRSKLSGLSAYQEAACISWIYNLGRGNFINSTFYKKLKAKDFASAKIECNKWVYSKGKKLNGLVKRRAAEATWITKLA